MQCICVYMYVSVYNAYICTCVHACVSECIYVPCISVYLYVKGIYVQPCTYVCICVYLDAYVLSVFTCMSMSICLCSWLSVYTSVCEHPYAICIRVFVCRRYLCVFVCAMRICISGYEAYVYISVYLYVRSMCKVCLKGVCVYLCVYMCICV